MDEIKIKQTNSKFKDEKIGIVFVIQFFKSKKMLELYKRPKTGYVFRDLYQNMMFHLKQ